MAILKDILYKVSLVSTFGDMNRKVNGITFDSREVKDGWLFIAVKGTRSDGHDYISRAIQSGAGSVVCEKRPEKIEEGVVYVQVRNSARAVGIIASNFYGNPSARLSVTAVTGTNGKTSIVTLLFELFRALGYRAGLLSTINNRINDGVIPSSHTTPDAIQINRLMAEMVKEGCAFCFMEASSHALEQERMAGLDINVAVFTNLTHDHLDYHKTFDAYLKAKKKLFDSLGKNAFALINADDKRGGIMIQNTKGAIKTYSLKKPSDYKAKILSNTFQGLELNIGDRSAWFHLAGEFNAYNLAAVYGTALLLGEKEAEVIRVLSGLGRVAGRFEVIAPHTGVTAIVDYAHTPDALENVLRTISDIRTKNESVITVVGCGGNRDREKRPKMAAIACRYSDKVILTSDNPRNEDPVEIIKEMMTGVTASNFKKTISITDRREAIKTAVSMIKKKDIILVAGKGHETYQEINGVRYDFDDRQVLEEYINMFFKN